MPKIILFGNNAFRNFINLLDDGSLNGMPVGINEDKLLHDFLFTKVGETEFGICGRTELRDRKKSNFDMDRFEMALSLQIRWAESNVFVIFPQNERELKYWLEFIPVEFRSTTQTRIVLPPNSNINVEQDKKIQITRPCNRKEFAEIICASLPENFIAQPTQPESAVPKIDSPRVEAPYDKADLLKKVVNAINEKYWHIVSCESVSVVDDIKKPGKKVIKFNFQDKKFAQFFSEKYRNAPISDGGLSVIAGELRAPFIFKDLEVENILPLLFSKSLPPQPSSQSPYSKIGGPGGYQITQAPATTAPHAAMHQPALSSRITPEEEVVNAINKKYPDWSCVGVDATDKAAIKFYFQNEKGVREFNEQYGLPDPEYYDDRFVITNKSKAISILEDLGLPAELLGLETACTIQ